MLNNALIAQQGSKSSVSIDGKYQMAFAGGYIWGSSDYGVTWTQRTTGASKSYTSAAINGTGQYWLTSVNPGSVWLSTDYGVTFNDVGGGISQNNSRAIISSTGQYQTLVGYYYIWRSTNYGSTWTNVSSVPIPTYQYKGAAMSSTGQYQTFGNAYGSLFKSSDYGVNFTEVASDTTRQWSCLAMSSTGQYQTAAIIGDYQWRSSDYGVTWTEVGYGSGTFNYHMDIDMNNSGQYQVGVSRLNAAQILRSTNYGVSWNIVTSTIGSTWYGCASNGSGSIMMACAVTNYIYKSTDYGATWIQMTSDTTRNWIDIAVNKLV